MYRCMLSSIKTKGLAIETAILLHKSMAGIYLHIPFCRKACHYCNFHFSTSLHRKPELLEAMKKEIAANNPENILLPDTPIETIYFGGGTPSLLSTSELSDLLESIAKYHKVSDAAEITLEANPDDIHPEILSDWKHAGINRLSIGIQSFREIDLTWMNRAHNEKQARKCIEMAADAGFDNLNIDLIYGGPTLPDDAWLANLETTRSLGITHLSCYALTVEENTALSHFIKKGKVPLPPEENQVRQFELLMDWARLSGWEHYEISNLCLPGHRSRHNSSYWTGKPYRGFGPSAHSFDGNLLRIMGIANNARYIDAWLHRRGEPYEQEILTGTQRLNEKIMTGLRRIEGIKLDAHLMTIEGEALSAKNWEHFMNALKGFEEDQLCTVERGIVKLTRKGILYADHVASGLFVS